MQQLLLDLPAGYAHGFDNFVAGAQCRGRWRCCRRPPRRHACDLLYLWGAPGSGRTHLLDATRLHAGRPTLHLQAMQAGDFTPRQRHAGAIDDVERLDEAGADRPVRRCSTRARRAALALVAGGVRSRRCDLPLREDLRTRLGSGLMFETQAAERRRKGAQRWRAGAAARGMRVCPRRRRLPADAHGRRDMPSLLAVLDALDRYSLEHKRPITLPLLREVLQGSAATLIA